MAYETPEVTAPIPPNVYEELDMDITTQSDYYNIRDNGAPTTGRTGQEGQEFEVKETNRSAGILNTPRLKMIACTLVMLLALAVALNVFWLILYLNKGNIHL